MEIHAHRAVLASVSPYLFELFSTDHEYKRSENVVTYKLNGGFDRTALQLLIEYAYTAKLEIPNNHVSKCYNNYKLNVILLKTHRLKLCI